MNNIVTQARTKIELLILAIVILVFFNIFSNAYNLGNALFGSYFVIPTHLVIAINVIFSVLAIYIVTCLIGLFNKEKAFYSLKKEQRHNENLALFIRELKHDFNNQLFVVNGMLQLGKTEEAQAYAQDIYEQFEWIESLLELRQPELSAIILNKLIYAKNVGIDVEATIEAHRIPVFSGELFIKTVGNILDNAIYALQKRTEGERKLFVDIYTFDDNLLIAIENTGEIPIEVSTRMFNRGFTTKSEKDGHGLGLHIVKSLMQNIGGDVNHRNEEGMTIFELNYPL